MADSLLFVGFTNVKGGPMRTLLEIRPTPDDFRTLCDGGYVGWEGQVGAYVKTGSKLHFGRFAAGMFGSWELPICHS